jgi:hypothetical protein
MAWQPEHEQQPAAAQPSAAMWLPAGSDYAVSPALAGRL